MADTRGIYLWEVEHEAVSHEHMLITTSKKEVRAAAIKATTLLEASYPDSLITKIEFAGIIDA